jgi:plastocyanin
MGSRMRLQLLCLACAIGCSGSSSPRSAGSAVTDGPPAGVTTTDAASPDGQPMSTAADSGDDAPPSSIEISPSSFTFPPKLVGQQGDTVTFTIRNVSSATIESLAADTGNDSFIIPPGGNRCLGPLPILGSCSVDVRFVPSVAGDVSGYLTIRLPDGTRSVASLSGDASPLPDAGPPPDPSLFRAMKPCLSASGYQVGTAVTTGGLRFSPSCLKVKKGTSVTFTEDFTAHPLRPSASRSDKENPILPTDTGTSASFVFWKTGFFGFFCANHGSSDDGLGMAGVIWVTE